MDHRGGRGARKGPDQRRRGLLLLRQSASGHSLTADSPRGIPRSPPSRSRWSPETPTTWTWPSATITWSCRTSSSRPRAEGRYHPWRPPKWSSAAAPCARNLSRTIAETIDFEPGIAQRSMGPAPARPVLRGLGGDRLLVLEDGERTGDLSASSSDHAVAIEPLTTERIEVVRGPRTLLYGSNALAGVVNVVRGYVPSVHPDGLGGSFTWQGESVNGALGAGLSLEHPLGPMALRADGSWRNASDIATPREYCPIRTSAPAMPRRASAWCGPGATRGFRQSLRLRLRHPSGPHGGSSARRVHRAGTPASGRTRRTPRRTGLAAAPGAEPRILALPARRVRG